MTTFTCDGRPMGFYADLELNCRVYHNCDDYGNKFTYHCPIDTAFRQDAMVCDHAHLVKCQRVEENPPDNTGQRNSQSAFTSFRQTQNTDRKNSGFSRSFRFGVDVPSNSVQNKNTTFFLSSSVFLRNHNNTFKKPSILQNKQINLPVTKSPLGFSRLTFNSTNYFPTKKIPSSTIPPFSGKPSTEKNSLNRNFDYDFLQPPPFRNDNTFIQSSLGKTTQKPKETFSNFENQKNKSRGFSEREEIQETSKSISKPSLLLEPPLFTDTKRSSVQFTTMLPLNFRSSNYPYTETLRSIQRETKTEKSLLTTTTRPATMKATTERTTESPFAILTASLEPLVPNQLEHDPYYPKHPTSTEIYYTPRDLVQDINFSKLSTRTHMPNFNLRIPSSIPDLNSLEDLVDRRKLFFIPKSRLS